MVNSIKALRWFFTGLLILVLAVTLLFVLDRFVFHLSIKEISSLDLKNITVLLILPLTAGILLAKVVETAFKKVKKP